MAGKTGKAFWFSTDNGDFITSKYYYNDYPDWARRWNGQRQAEKYAGTEWELSSDISSYLLAGQDDRPYEMDLKGYGRTFPHRFGEAGNKLLFTQIVVSSICRSAFPEWMRSTTSSGRRALKTKKSYAVSIAPWQICSHLSTKP
jgi:hypothetical protein